MGWLIALAVTAGIALLPVGICLKYNTDGLYLSLLVGHFKVKLFPAPQKEKKQKEKKNTVKTTKTQPQKEKPSEKGGKWTEFLPLVELGIRLLGDLRRKIRIRRLELMLVLAGDDPCDLAIQYGKAWTAVGNLMPMLERLFLIKKRDIEVQCDFTADTSRILAQADITITVGRVVALAVYYGAKALREYFKITKIRKGGAAK